MKNCKNKEHAKPCHCNTICGGCKLSACAANFPYHICTPKSFEHRCVPIKLPIPGTNRISHYQLKWCILNKQTGCKQPYHRNTDAFHARSFCKRWGLDFPL